MSDNICLFYSRSVDHLNHIQSYAWTWRMEGRTPYRPTLLITQTTITIWEIGMVMSIHIDPNLSAPIMFRRESSKRDLGLRYGPGSIDRRNRGHCFPSFSPWDNSALWLQ